MAFKNRVRPKQQVELVSFVDMVFILLVFFMVTSFSIKNPLKEITLSIPVPENERGRAQILVQLVDETHAFWMDESASEIVFEIENTLGYLSDEKQRDRIMQELVSRDVMTHDQLAEKIELLKKKAYDNPMDNYFVMIRCPNDLPYIHVIKIIKLFSNMTMRTISYGCVAGTLDEIKRCRRIHTVLEPRPDGSQRKNIAIDF